MASLATAATTTCSYLPRHHRRQLEYSCHCWYPSEQCQTSRRRKRRSSLGEEQTQMMSRTRSSSLCENVSINQNHEPYFAKSKQQHHLMTNYPALQPSAASPLSLPANNNNGCLAATPSSSSLMSKALINIHKHTSYLCQILELLRVTATTTHSNCTATDCATTKTAASTARASSGTVIEPILTDKVNEPVKYLTTMMEQAEDICISENSHKSMLLSAPVRSSWATSTSDDDESTATSASPHSSPRNQCVHLHQDQFCHSTTTAFARSGLDCSRLPCCGIRSFDDNSHLCTPVASSPSCPSCLTTTSPHYRRHNHQTEWSRLVRSLVPRLSSAVTSSLTSSLFLTLLLLFTFMLHTADSCSSRSTPKPRPPTPTTRPNITFQTMACPEAYAKWFCLNGATCFSVPIGDSILYNCECAEGYMGQRCEFKDPVGSYLPTREKILVETAGIAGGVTLVVLLVVVISIAYYTYLRNHMRAKSPPLLGYSHEEGAMDRDDGESLYSSNYQHNIRQHYQYSTFDKGTASSSSCSPNSCTGRVLHAAPSSSAKYATTTYGAALIPSARINYDSSLPLGTAAPAPPSRQCVACMSKLHHQQQQQLPQQQPPQIKAPNQKASSVLDLEHGIARHQNHKQNQQYYNSSGKNPFAHISSSDLC